MPRPRRDPKFCRHGTTFGECVLGAPATTYGKITVTDIVREGGLNRNSFYYHFSGLPELADATIMHAVESIPIMGQHHRCRESVAGMAAHMHRGVQRPQMRKQFDHLALLAGPHSTIELTEALRDFIRLTLLGNFDLDYDRIDLSTRILLDFTVGGIVGVLRDWPNIEHRLSPNDLTNPDIATVAANLRTALDSSEQRRPVQSLR